MRNANELSRGNVSACAESSLPSSRKACLVRSSGVAMCETPTAMASTAVGYAHQLIAVAKCTVIDDGDKRKVSPNDQLFSSLRTAAGPPDVVSKSRPHQSRSGLPMKTAVLHKLG